ncbi:MAG: MFS transporter [Chlamydiales bacterium]|nr:MFS transporter [Chlamydiales bacterium]
MAKILCWAEPFGFGPTAALSYFAPYLPGPRDFAGTSFTSDLQNTNTFRRILHCDSVLSDEGAAQFRELCSRYPMTFISCDFKAAEISVAAGCKTILYDPICWFWRGKLPDICHQVDAYICQDFFGVKERLEKEQIKNAYLVPPLFPKEPISLKCCNEIGAREGVLVNLGGLQNPFMDVEECRKYASLILDTVAPSTDSSYVGYSSRAVVEGIKGHPVYTGTPEELRKKLASSTIAFMTPGLGNIYDASILGNVVCFLPPTNDSQGQQLNHLRKANLAPFSIDWHEIIEGMEPIDYTAPSQAAISKQISSCLCHLLEDARVGSLLVLITAILADRYSGPNLARTLSLFALIFPFAFAVSPIIGAQMYTLFGWQWVFGALFIGVLPIALMLLWQLPETCKGQKKEKIFQELKLIAKSKRHIALAMLHGLPITIGLLFTINGAFLYQTVYEYDALAFAYIQATPVACQSLGALAYRPIVRSIGLKAVLQIGLYLTLFFITLCLMSILQYIEGPIVTVLTVSSFTLGASFLITTAATLLLDEYKEAKGLDTSFLSLMRNLAIVIVALAASFLPHNSSIPTISTMLVVALVLCLLIPIVLTTQSKEDCPITR